MAQLVIKSTERKPVAGVADMSGAHLWGDVVDIVADHAATDHYVPDPFLVIRVPAERDELAYLLEPLTTQESELNEGGEEIGPKSLLRKRYGIVIESLPDAQRLELCSTGKTTLSLYMLEASTQSRSA